MWVFVWCLFPQTYAVEIPWNDIFLAVKKLKNESEHDWKGKYGVYKLGT